jgi:hypothetical protein
LGPIENRQCELVWRYPGFDAKAEVFLTGEKVYRGIYPGAGTVYRKVLRICQEEDLFRLGIIGTRESDLSPYPELGYDLVLEHDKVPFISYAHEWPAAMLRDAALFHVDLYRELARRNLTIKDWHPYNILFRDAEPVFVDFTSIIPTEDLKAESYLTPPCVPRGFRRLWDSTSAYLNEMHRRMFLPYFLLPLSMMHQGRYKKARRRMLETTLNASCSVIEEREVFQGRNGSRLIYEVNQALKRIALLERTTAKKNFWRAVRREIEGLKVSVSKSVYTGYYKQKREDFAFEPSEKWPDKHRIVYEVMRGTKLETVLDVSCNTGWFSVLAARQGSRVVAFDIDEACMNLLYSQAKREKLSIMPLVLDLADLTPDVFPITYDDEPERSHIGGDFPILLSTEKRLKCDLVLALAIVHHMVLGQGWSLQKMTDILAGFTKKYLIVEFVAKEDPLVMGEPTFFPALSAAPHGFGWYTFDNFVRELEKKFRQIRVFQSSGATRIMLSCER